jgi:hypothetical protein
MNDGIRNKPPHPFVFIIADLVWWETSPLVAMEEDPGMRVDSISMAEYWSLARQQPEYLTI